MEVTWQPADQYMMSHHATGFRGRSSPCWPLPPLKEGSLKPPRLTWSMLAHGSKVNTSHDAARPRSFLWKQPDIKELLGHNQRAKSNIHSVSTEASKAHKAGKVLSSPPSRKTSRSPWKRDQKSNKSKRSKPQESTQSNNSMVTFRELRPLWMNQSAHRGQSQEVWGHAFRRRTRSL